MSTQQSAQSDTFEEAMKRGYELHSLKSVPVKLTKEDIDEFFKTEGQNIEQGNLERSITYFTENIAKTEVLNHIINRINKKSTSDELANYFKSKLNKIDLEKTIETKLIENNFKMTKEIEKHKSDLSDYNDLRTNPYSTA